MKKQTVFGVALERINNYLHGTDLQGRPLYTRLTSGPGYSAFGSSSGTSGGFNTPALGSISGGPAPKKALGAIGKPLSQFIAGEANTGKGGRTSFPSTVTIMGTLAWLPRRQSIASLENLDLSRLTPEQIIDGLMDAHPDVGLAIWNTLRLANSGWSINVKDQYGEKDHKAGYAAAMKILRRVNATGGGIDVLVDTLHLMTYMQGAACVEAAPRPGLTELEDIYPINPSTIRFRWLNVGTLEAPIFQLAMQQWTLAHYAPRWLNPAQCFYIPLDPAVDEPYGRAAVLGSVGAILFWIDLLSDLRRALHMSAFGRLNITVIEQVLKENAPPEIAEDEQAMRAWMQDILADVAKNYANLEPDDALVHFNSVEMSSLDAAGKLFDVTPLLQHVEHMIIRGLKQLPTLMGAAEGSRGAGQLGSLEYQIYSTGIEAIQLRSALCIERSLELGLRLLGYQCQVEWQWDPIRTTDRLKDAQAEALETQNAIRQYEQGWISQQQASNTVVGQEPELSEPRPITNPLINKDRPSPPPMPTNQQNPQDKTKIDPNKIPTVLDTTKEGGDQAGAPKPAPSRVDQDLIDILSRVEA